jgi:hypothetical protein
VISTLDQAPWSSFPSTSAPYRTLSLQYLYPAQSFAPLWAMNNMAFIITIRRSAITYSLNPETSLATSDFTSILKPAPSYTSLPFWKTTCLPFGILTATSPRAWTGIML